MLRSLLDRFVDDTLKYVQAETVTVSRGIHYCSASGMPVLQFPCD